MKYEIGDDMSEDEIVWAELVNEIWADEAIA
jgi:hypothetical protein